jgi:hypothetical protein
MTSEKTAGLIPYDSKSEIDLPLQSGEFEKLEEQGYAFKTIS